MVDIEISEEESNTLWQEFGTKNVTRSSEKRLLYLILERPRRLRKLISSGRLWEHLEDTAERAKRYREDVLRMLWERNPPKEGESPEAVRNMHMLMAEEMVMANIISPEASVEREE